MASLTKIMDRTKFRGRTILSVPQGWIDGVYYIKGVATDLDSAGSGVWNGATYVNGIKQR